MKKNINCWVCNSKKIKDFNIVSDIKINHYLCTNCYFLFSKTNLKKNNQVKYYSNITENKLIERYFNNEYFDTARFLNYINLIIKKNCKIGKKLTHLDIGGGFGFFSKVLKKKYNQITSYNLEPDKNAARIAEKLNKNIKTINLPFEKINKLKKINFDLITYWGGIYRTVEPNKVFKYLKTICHKNCNFFFSLPLYFDDIRTGHLELKNSFDDYLITEDGAKGFFGRNHMKIFLEKNNFSFKETIIQNKPFRKKFPIYSFNYQKEKKELKKRNINFKKYFKKNISVYNDFYIDQIKRSIYKNSGNKIYIFGSNFLSEYAYKYLKNRKKKKLILISNFSADLYKKPNLLKESLNVNNYNSSIFLICENKKDNIIKNSLINRLHVNLKNSVYILDKDFNLEKDSFKFENNIYLKKKINFLKI